MPHYHDKIIIQQLINPFKMWEVEIYGNDSNKLKSHSWRNWEQIKCGEYFPPFCSRHFVFQFPIKCKEEYTHKTISFYLYGHETWLLTLR
jgi:hypothetical protein